MKFKTPLSSAPRRSSSAATSFLKLFSGVKFEAGMQLSLNATSARTTTTAAARAYSSVLDST
eukprot:5101188-Pyramimonas_sp.AAC.1